MESEVLIKQGEFYADFDVVVIGSGVHGAIFAYNLLQKDPKAKVLLLDQSDTISAHFRTLDYSLNNPLHLKAEFAGVPLYITSHHFLVGTKASPQIGWPEKYRFGHPFQVAYSLWNQIIFTLYYSGTSPVLSAQVKRIEREKSEGQDRYLLEVDGLNRKISARNVVVSTGFGKQAPLNYTDKKFESEQKIKAIHCKKALCKAEDLPKVFNFDDLIEISRKFREKQKDLSDYFAEEDVAIVGAGCSRDCFYRMGIRRWS